MPFQPNPVANHLLELRVRISPRRWTSVYWMLQSGGLCNGSITCSEESYRVWCVNECHLLQQ